MPVRALLYSLILVSACSASRSRVENEAGDASTDSGADASIDSTRDAGPPPRYVIEPEHDIVGVLPEGAGEGECVDVGEPFRKLCDGDWCLAANITPTQTPALVGGTSARDVWVLGDDRVLVHRGCSGWSVVALPAPLDEEWAPSACDGCTIAARRPDDVWLTVERGFFHFDGDSWSRVERPGNLFDGGFWLAGDEVWFTGQSRALRFEDGEWIDLSSGLGPGIEALASDGNGGAWIVGDELFMRFDGARWTALVAPERNEEDEGTIDSFVVFSPDDAWIGGREHRVQHWDGAAWEAFDVRGSVHGVTPDDVWILRGEVLHFDGTGFRVGPSLGMRAPAAGAVIGDHMWIADQTGTISFVEEGALQAAIGELTPLVGVSELALFAPHDAWAISVYTGAVLRNDGTAWREVHALMPDYAISPAYSPYMRPSVHMVARSSRDIWFSALRDRVGTAFTHWDGDGYREIVLDDVESIGLWGSGLDRLWTHDTQAVYAWDGQEWSEQKPFATIAYALEIDALTGSSSDDVWTAAHAVHEEGPSLLAHWNGQGWTSLELPHLHQVAAIAVRNANDVIVVCGLSVLHWDGLELRDVTPDGLRSTPNTLLVLSDGTFWLEDLDEDFASSWAWRDGEWEPQPDLGDFGVTTGLSVDQLWHVDGRGIWRFTGYSASTAPAR